MEIQYEIKNTIYGKGLFTKEHIISGKCIWKYINVLEYDEFACKEYLRSLKPDEAIQFLDLSYGRGEKLCLITDDGRFINHSETPNCKTNMITGDVYAIKDISIGDELFEDYASFDHPSYIYDLLEFYQCKPDYYNI